MKSPFQHIRRAVPLLARGPGLTAITLITLALVIAANTALFSLINGMRPMPQHFADADELVFFWKTREREERRQGTVGALDHLDWREQAAEFAGLPLCACNSRILTGAGEPGRVSATHGTTNLVPMLAFDARIGLLHTVNEDLAGDTRVVVLTHRLWECRLNVFCRFRIMSHTRGCRVRQTPAITASEARGVKAALSIL